MVTMAAFLHDNAWALAAILLLFAFYLWKRYGLYLRGIRQVDAPTAERMVAEEDAVIVDVRERREYASAHIPGSRHLSLGKLRRHPEALDRYRGRPLVLSCRSGARSARACIVLKKHGFEEVYNLRGGINAWMRAKRRQKG